MELREGSPGSGLGRDRHKDLPGHKDLPFLNVDAGGVVHEGLDRPLAGLGSIVAAGTLARRGFDHCAILVDEAEGRRTGFCALVRNRRIGGGWNNVCHFGGGGNYPVTLIFADLRCKTSQSWITGKTNGRQSFYTRPYL